MPVPPRRHARVGRPGHHVRDARVQLLITAGTAVRLGGRRAGHRADDPVAVRPVLNPLGTERRGRRGGPEFPGLTRAHSDQPIYEGITEEFLVATRGRHWLVRTTVPLCDLSSRGAASTTTAGSPLTFRPLSGCSS